ncbi:hypothetical protein Tsp_05411 [Trichinella spiralis]|uniref:hypothetical protein n=1 Tax=Trichinella spiralis TaxID=6334 RepID=UPI0001EFD557|nr:hypothetical protein Tsp_05411 [Trichinella spiralis]
MGIKESNEKCKRIAAVLQPLHWTWNTDRAHLGIKYIKYEKRFSRELFYEVNFHEQQRCSEHFAQRLQSGHNQMGQQLSRHCEFSQSSTIDPGHRPAKVFQARQAISYTRPAPLVLAEVFSEAINRIGQSE